MFVIPEGNLRLHSIIADHNPPYEDYLQEDCSGLLQAATEITEGGYSMEVAFPQLGSRQQKGSKPRCHLLTLGTNADVAARLTALIKPWGTVRPNDQWMPSGFERCAEAQLHSSSAILSNRQDRDALRDWWLAIATDRTTTPNIDLASTCLVQGEEGILLVEAKAHDYELRKEEQGKSLSATSSEESRRNHEQIGLAIQAANRSLSVETKLPWSLSRDAGYQMSNRFAWAWKVTQLGILVILAYLGFVGCEEMRRGKTIQPIASQEEWEKLVQNHSRPLFPDEVWNQQWRVQDKSFIPVILTTDQPLSRG